MISAIIPCCNEYPQVLFTVQSVLEDGADEVIVISNKSTDKTNEYFTALQNPKVKFFVKDDKLSHWRAKNLGIQESIGDLLFFVDAHCLLTLGTLGHLKDVIEQCAYPGGKIAHCVIHYMLDPRGLIYAPRFEKFNYRFCSAPNASSFYKVAVMSTCGMMIQRDIIGRGWNSELGIYGGGEAYINWKLGVLGNVHYVHGSAHCWHYAEKRGYSWNYDDFMRNEFIAAYCVGGEKWLGKLIDQRKERGNPAVVDKIALDVMEKCRDDREYIEAHQVMTFDEYVEKWK